ncbi:MAG: hypothetical protein JWP63_5920 [Candidatus Solibacter sp.]|jgi:hypothetical protein|nr:hypothetical protein [Candidatus Solibacter sp.]
MRSIALAALLLLPAAAAELKPKTLAAFDQFVRQTEDRLAASKPFLWADESPDRARRVKAGEVLVTPFHAKSEIKVPDGLIHDWVGSVFIPNTTMAKVLALVQDYDHHKDVFKPEVIDSKLLSRQGNDFRINLRLLKKKVITVVLNSEHEVKYSQVDATRWRSASHTTKITEVENSGKQDEREKPPGTGEGFLWRLNSYWRFEERDGGVWMECEALSLTRDVPTGLGWLIEPIIRNLPKESLENTLRSTRAALVK